MRCAGLERHDLPAVPIACLLVLSYVRVSTVLRGPTYGSHLVTNTRTSFIPFEGCHPMYGDRCHTLLCSHCMVWHMLRAMCVVFRNTAACSHDRFTLHLWGLQMSLGPEALKALRTDCWGPVANKLGLMTECYTCAETTWSLPWRIAWSWTPSAPQ
jgi:hypothetical protein